MADNLKEKEGRKQNDKKSHTRQQKEKQNKGKEIKKG